MAGFDVSRISWDGDNIWANFQGLGFGVGTIASIDVTPTPIPSAALLLGTGLIGLVGLRRRGFRKS